MRQRLSKILSNAGIASRRACEKLIFEGRITVNGKVVTSPQARVHEDLDQIAFDGTPLKPVHTKLYWMLNKPKGYHCSHRRIGLQRLIWDLLPPSNIRLFTVGRLDKDTTGLILVTNDGHFAHQIIHPSMGLTKTYLLKAVQELTPDHLSLLREGIRIDGEWIRPVAVHKVRRGTCKISIQEGKKREVRLLAQRAKLDVVELKRIRIGSLELGSLPEGQYRELTRNEQDELLRKKN